MGDLVFVELPDVGASLEQGDDAAVVESVKAASDVYAPATGEVTEVNDALSADAAIVNKSAENEGWLYKIRLGDADELEKLMDEAAYKNMIG